MQLVTVPDFLIAGRPVDEGRSPYTSQVAHQDIGFFGNPKAVEAEEHLHHVP